MSVLNFIMLQAGGEGQGSAGMVNLLMIVAIIVVFYFFMIRPQQKKQKEIRKFRESIVEGQHVVTAGGIYGKVKKIKETTFSIEIAPNICITVDKGSVYPTAQVAQESAESEKK